MQTLHIFLTPSQSRAVTDDELLRFIADARKASEASDGSRVPAPIVGKRFADTQDDTTPTLRDLPAGQDWSRLIFIGCDFSHVHFPEDIHLAHARFVGCDFEHAVFDAPASPEAYYNAHWSDCNFTFTVFKAAVLRNNTFDSCTLCCVDLARAELHSCSVTGCDLLDTDLSYATLRHSAIAHSSLFGTNLCGANLSTASFEFNDYGGYSPPKVDITTRLNTTQHEQIAMVLRHALDDESCEYQDLLIRREVVAMLLEMREWCWSEFIHYARQRIEQGDERAHKGLAWIFETLRGYPDACRRLFVNGNHSLDGIIDSAALEEYQRSEHQRSAEMLQLLGIPQAQDAAPDNTGGHTGREE